MSLNPQQRLQLSRAASAAYGAELEIGCPAELTLAQWAVESGWGEHSPGNNPFGIKAGDRERGQVLPTKEVMAGGKERTVLQRFAIFDTLQQAFERHARLLCYGPNYKVAFDSYCQNEDLAAFTRRVALKYATGEQNPDPTQRYSTQLFAVMAMPEVQEALAQVRSAGQGAAA